MMSQEYYVANFQQQDLTMIKKQVGVTLLELLVALTILSILATIGFPSMARFIQSQQLTSTTNELLGDIQRTRTNALRNSIIASLSIRDDLCQNGDTHAFCIKGYSQTGDPLPNIQFGPQGQLLQIKGDPPPFGYINIKHKALNQSRCITLLPTGNAFVATCPEQNL